MQKTNGKKSGERGEGLGKKAACGSIDDYIIFTCPELLSFLLAENLLQFVLTQHFVTCGKRNQSLFLQMD